MKIYIVRKSLTKDDSVIRKGAALSKWDNYSDATREVIRLYEETGLECHITTEEE